MLLSRVAMGSARAGLRSNSSNKGQRVATVYPQRIIYCNSSACAKARPRGRRQIVALASSGAAERRVTELTRELSVLEKERDEAISTGESCAKTCVRLADMVQLLDKLALEKVQNGDDKAAKSILQEKASVKEVLDKSTQRSQVNFALAMKLAEKIGQRQDELVSLLGPGRVGSGKSATSSTSSAAKSATSNVPDSSSRYQSNSSWQNSPPSVPPAYRKEPVKPKWVESLEAAQERINQAETRASGIGLTARMSAEQSVAEALARLKQNQSENIVEAARRVRRDSGANILEAQQRLREQEAAMLEKVRRLVSRYRSGESINDDELELAFFALERSVGRRTN